MGIEQLHEHIANNDITSIKKLIEEENLYVEDGKIFIKDKEEATEKSDYWDTMSLIKKIGNNSIYGALTNAASNFFDTRMGQSCTLTGRCTTRHMGSKINETLVGKYDLGEIVTYGDSVDGDSIIKTSIGEIPIKNLYEKYSSTYNIGEKEYVSPTDENILVAGYANNNVVMSDINFIMRHKTNKEKWQIETRCGKKIIVTNDHSIMVDRDNNIVEVKPEDLKEEDIVITVVGKSKIKVVTKLGNFNNEYVYDISIKDNDTVFFANDILVKNTDSIYFTIPENVKKDLTKDEFIEISDQIGKSVNESFGEFYKETFNVSEDKSKVIKCAREICATSALFIKKKRYAAMVYDEKNFRYDTDGKFGKLKVMGLDIKRADCPVWVQDKLKHTIDEILGKNKSADEVVDYVREWRNEFMQSDPWKMGIPKRVNKLTYYTDVFNKNTKGVTVPGHVRASINWNKIISDKHDINSMKITDGFKVIVCKLQPNMYNIETIAYPIDQSHLPEWFKELPFDKEAMVDVAIDKKVQNIFGILDIDLDLSKINDEEGMLEWE